MHLEMGTNYGETDEEEECRIAVLFVCILIFFKYYTNWKQPCFSCISDKLLRLRKTKNEKFQKI